MSNANCTELGIENPIFAFTHCRDVVVAVSRAGGLGVLGAVGFTPEQLRVELDWIDAHIGDKPYAVDIVMPQKYEGMDESDPAALLERLEKMIPDEHRALANRLLDEHGVPAMPADDGPKGGLQGWTLATAKPLLDEALKRPRVRLIANALGTPPPEIIDEIHRTHTYAGAGDTQAVAFNPVGQVVGQITAAQSTAEIVRDLLTQFVDAVEHLNAALPEGQAG